MKYNFIAFFLLFFTLNTDAQYASIFSEYGLGKLQSPVFSNNRASGGISAGYISTGAINYLNPASYAYSNLTTFDVGAFTETGTSHVGDSNYLSSSGSISHLALLMPIKSNKWGLALGIKPYSNSRFISSTDYIDSIVGPVSHYHELKGGLNQIFIGSGYRIKNLSFGVNIGFLFGNMINHNFYDIYDSAGVDARYTRNANINTLYYNAGIQYKVKLHNNDYFIFGAYGASNILVNSEAITLKRTRYVFGSRSYENGMSDTTNYPFLLPSDLGVGFTFNQKGYITYGMDFSMINWSITRYNIGASTLNNKWKIALGVEVKPFLKENVKIKKYFNRMVYRIGTNFGKSEQLISDGAVNEFCVSGGLSFPVKAPKLISYLNLGFDIGGRGIDNKTYSESYWRINLGFTITDRWFIRQKFD